MDRSDAGRDAARHRGGAGISQRQEQFEQLYRENSRPILAYALRRTERREDAADVLSEVMLIVWRRLEDVPPGREARLWLFGVARRVIANANRSAAVRLRLGKRLRHEVSRFPVGEEGEMGEERETVRAALRRLPEGDREILLLVTWEDLKPNEAAKVMGISAPAARTRLHRARRRLCRVLAATGANDEPGPQQRSLTETGLYPRMEEES